MGDLPTSPVCDRTRILLVDDFPVVRRGIARLLANEPDMLVCGEAGDVAEAMDLVVSQVPELVIVDLSLRGGHGMELLERLKNRECPPKTLVYSMYDEGLYAERAIRAGAMGYVNKQESPETLVNAIREVLGGRLHLSPTISRRLLHMVLRGQPPQNDAIACLSNRELQVFEMIGQGLSTKKIASQLGLSRKTIEAHREKIKAKLNLSCGVELSYRAAQWVLEGNRGR
jgi:DNA-binding NarL/FixJ family response regulator